MNLSRSVTRRHVVAGIASFCLMSSPHRLCNAQATPKPATLEALLGQVRWSTAQLGPLLIVAPEETPVRQKRILRHFRWQWEPAVVLPPPQDGSFSLADLADTFGRKVVRCGSLHVFAPSTMATLGDKTLPPPSALAGAGGQEGFRALMGSLSRPQWQQIGSAAGIGYTDLTPEQRPIWDAIFPADLTVYREQGPPLGRGEEPDPKRPPLPLPVSAQQRGQMRLKINQSLEWALINRRDSGASGEGSAAFTPPGQPRQSLAIQFTPDTPDKVLGVTVRRDVPATLKPGDLPLDWAGLDAAVRLDGVKTVGQMVKRIANQTRVELHCDVRYARLGLHSRGETARAGDILMALCRGVTGTFRKVGPAYVLTDDREGLGTRHARIHAWVHANHALRRRAQHLIDEQLAAQEALSFLSFAPGDPRTPPPALQERLRKFQAGDPDAGVTVKGLELYRRLVPLAELSPVAQKQVREQAVRNVQESGGRRESRTDVVSVSFTQHATVTIPGIGAADLGFTLARSRMEHWQGAWRAATTAATPALKTHTLPQPARRPLLLAPRNPDEAKQAITLAKDTGFTEVWIAQDDDQDTSVLEAAVAAGKGQVPVYALARAWRTRQPALALADQNLRGETWAEFVARLGSQPTAPASGGGGIVGDLQPAQQQETLAQLEWGTWLAPASDDAQQSRLAALAKIAQTPGLAGLAVRDLVPPGYDFYLLALNAYEAGKPQSGDFGYTEAMRLQFLRQSGVDPVDLSMMGDVPPRGGDDLFGFQEANLALPFFPSLDRGRAEGGATRTIVNGVMTRRPTDGAIYAGWIKFRAQAAHGANRKLLTALRASAGTLPIVCTGNPDLPFAESFGSSLLAYLSLDVGKFPLGEPVFDLDAPAEPWPKEPQAQRKRLHRDSELVFIGWTYVRAEQSSPLGQDTLESAVRAVSPAHDGFVVDLSRVSLDLARVQLQRFKPKP